MVALSIAAACAGLFAGAAIYINAVEHPARLGCGNEVALKEFGPSYRRATVMQGRWRWRAAPQVWAAWIRVIFRDGRRGLSGALVPFTLAASCRRTAYCLSPPSTLVAGCDRFWCGGAVFTPYAAL